MDKTDAQLIAEYLHGDDLSLEILIERHLKPVLNFVYRFVGSKTDAEDITQEIFVKLWKQIKRYDPAQSFRAWLFRIARNASIDWMRKKKDVVLSVFDNEDGNNSLLDTMADTEPLVDELMTKTQDKQMLDALIADLAPHYRLVLFMHYHEHMTFDEIGQVLDKPLDTVKSQHRRALIKLRELMP